jgi:hypothetical protein
MVLDPNAKNNDRRTLLHIAVSKGRVDVISFLLERGADPNAKNIFGWTPLHIAAFFGHVDVVRVLLEYGADPRIADNEGHIPLDYANDSAIRSLLESALRIMQIPNYEVLEKIGEGGFAIVYKARRKKDSLLVAIKVPKVADKDFVKELAVWQNLNHPNIVKLIDFDINPRPYMVMELMKGGSLHGKTFDKDTATRII